MQNLRQREDIIILVCHILFTRIFRIKFHDVDRALNDDNKCKMNVKTFKGIISHVTNGNDFHWTLYATYITEIYSVKLVWLHCIKP